MSQLGQTVFKEFLANKKQISRISDKVHNLKIVIDEEREKSYIIKLNGIKLIIGNKFRKFFKILVLKCK